MQKAMRDIQNSTFLQYRQVTTNPGSEIYSIFLFVTSVARTNFEIELVQRGGSLCTSPPSTISLTPKRDCIGKLQ